MIPKLSSVHKTKSLGEMVLSLNEMAMKLSNLGNGFSPDEYQLKLAQISLETAAIHIMQHLKSENSGIK